MLKNLIKVLKGMAYGTALVIASAIPIYLLDVEDWPIVKGAISVSMIKFGLAMAGVVMAEVFYAWRFHINVVTAYDKVEDSPVALAVLMGSIFAGSCLVASAVFH